MAEQDRSTRGTEKSEVAYFIPKHAASYAFIGHMGHRHHFSKEKPGVITMTQDIKYLRAKQDVVETDVTGKPLAEEIGTTKRQPLSYTKTAPAISPSPSSPSPEDGEVLKGDKKKKKKKKVPNSPEDEDQDEDDEEEEEEEEEPRKKKKKKKTGEKKSVKKKKKKKKKKRSTDWDDEDD